VHREQIAFDDPGVAHRHAAHAQQVIGARREEIRVDLVAPLHMLFGEHRAAGGNAADHRQFEQPSGARAGAVVAHLDAARGARGDVDGAFSLQRAQVLFGGIDRAEAHALGDLGARRRKARHLGQLADQLENFRLPVCKGIH
jgi:hypothetical protein